MSKTRRYDYRERGGVTNHMKKVGKKRTVRGLQEEEFDPDAWSEYNYEDVEEYEGEEYD